jgi:hypothetical protein
VRAFDAFADVQPSLWRTGLQMNTCLPQKTQQVFAGTQAFLLNARLLLARLEDTVE